MDVPTSTAARKLPDVAGWIKLAVRSFAVAALFGAAQLGAAQALALLTWGSVPAPDVWRRELMWLLFIFGAAVLGGVAGGRRSVRAIRLAIGNRRAIAAAQRHSGLTMHESGMRAARRRAVAAAKDKTVDKARGFAAGAARVSATLFAALGAATSFALVWLPARNAFGSADINTLALTAGIGIVVGSVISLLSLAASPIAANAGMTIIWIWVFGLTSVGLAIATGRPTQTPRLGVLDAPYLIGPGEWWLGPNLMVAVAAAVGLAVAAAARWIGAQRLGVALSGLAGPALLAAGYLLVGPEGESMGGYVASLLAATVGLLTSAATAAAHRSTAVDEPRPSAPQAITAGPGVAGPLGAAPLAINAARASAPARAELDPRYAPPQPLYLAPARSAPVAPSRAAAPIPQPRGATAATFGPGTAPAARPGAGPASSAPPSTGAWPSASPAPDPGSAWPGGVPGPYAAPPVAAPSRPTSRPVPAPAQAAPPAAPPVQQAPVRPMPASAAAQAAPRPTAPTPAAPPTRPVASTTSVPPRAAKPAVAHPQPAAAPPAPPAVAVPAPAPTTPVARPTSAPAAAGIGAPSTSAATAPVTNAGPARPAAVTNPPKAEPAAQTAPKAPAKSSKPARGKRARNAPEPQPVAAAESVVPRTAKPAQVVAVEASQPSVAPAVQPTGRRAKRRAAREAERVAAEQTAIAARDARRDRRAPALDKRELEHVDWVQHLISLPNDPTLTSRDK
jgi:hypothetical protein